MAEYAEELEDFRNWLSSKAQIQLLHAKTGDETDALLSILAHNLGYIIALVAAKHPDPAFAANAMAEALTQAVFDTSAGWLPMAVAAANRDGKGFMAAFERRSARPRPGEIPPGGEE